METPKTLPGTDIVGYLVDPKTGNRLESATPRAIARGWWEITDLRPGVWALAADAGYRYYDCPPRWDTGPGRNYVSMWGGKGREYGEQHRIEQPATPVTVTPDDRHTRHYASAAMAAYMEAEIAKELAKLDKETASRKHRTKVAEDAKWTARCIEQGRPPISATAFDTIAEGVSFDGEWHAHPGGYEACSLNMAVFVDRNGWDFPMRDSRLCTGYRRCEDAVYEARRRQSRSDVKYVA